MTSPAKRQKTYTQSFSADADLEVEVEEEVFHVHSLVLMLASPVFRQMLSHDMKEASSRRIRLPDKKKDEFKVFLEAMQPFSISTFSLTKETASFLASWSEEYQVTVLKAKCEEHLMTHATIDIHALVHAVACNLPARKTQCMDHIAKDIVRFSDQLETMGPTLPADVLEALWPSICKEANVKMDVPKDLSHVRTMWPFVLNATTNIAVRQASCELKAEREKMATLMRKVTALQHKAKVWPGQMHSALPASHAADEKGRLFMAYNVVPLIDSLTT